MLPAEVVTLDRGATGKSWPVGRSSPNTQTVTRKQAVRYWSPGELALQISDAAAAAARWGMVCIFLNPDLSLFLLLHWW